MSEIANPPSDAIKKLLQESKTIAIVGLSPKPDRASNDVAGYLKKNGYRIIPVNPGHDEILGEKSYASLSEIPEKIDIVDIFRRPEHVGPIIDEALKTDAPIVWLQLGIRNDEEAQKVVDAGRIVIQDKCIKQEHQHLL